MSLAIGQASAGRAYLSLRCTCARRRSPVALPSKGNGLSGRIQVNGRRPQRPTSVIASRTDSDNDKEWADDLIRELQESDEEDARLFDRSTLREGEQERDTVIPILVGICLAAYAAVGLLGMFY